MAKTKYHMDRKYRRRLDETPRQHELRDSGQEAGGIKEDNEGSADPPRVVPEPVAEKKKLRKN